MLVEGKQYRYTLVKSADELSKAYIQKFVKPHTTIRFQKCYEERGIVIDSFKKRKTKGGK